ncbi:hypothetical protein GB931_06860 [Modestobacter sp. I12A-02628]|nr:hypothetical protein [Goekera deserti]
MSPSPRRCWPGSTRCSGTSWSGTRARPPAAEKGPLFPPPLASSRRDPEEGPDDGQAPGGLPVTRR